MSKKELRELIEEQADDMAYGSRAWPEKYKGMRHQSLDALREDGFDIDPEGKLSHFSKSFNLYLRDAPLRTAKTKIGCQDSSHERDASGRCKNCRNRRQREYRKRHPLTAEQKQKQRDYQREYHKKYDKERYRKSKESE